MTASTNFLEHYVSNSSATQIFILLNHLQTLNPIVHISKALKGVERTMNNEMYTWRNTIISYDTRKF